MPKFKCFSSICPQSSLLSVLSHAYQSHLLVKHGINFRVYNPAKEINHIQLKKQHLSFMMMLMTTMMVTVGDSGRGNDGISWHTLSASTNQCYSKHFPHIMSFNLHNNPMKYLLFITHSKDEKYNGQRVNQLWRSHSKCQSHKYHFKRYAMK